MNPRAPDNAPHRTNLALRVCLAAAVLFPIAAQGSFGGTPCGDDFACHFQVWGLLLGAVGGVPISIFIFMCLHVGFCNPKRSKDRQFWLGGFIGILAYELSAACAALMGTWGKDPVLGLASAYVLLAIASARYARSSPKESS